MTLLESIHVPLGTEMPEFSLEDSQKITYRSQDLFGSAGLIVMFACLHCPYVQAIWERFCKVETYAKDLNINVIAINSNIHPDYPEDSIESMKEKVGKWDLGFPFLVDATQDIARSFKAQCTPDIYLFDQNKKLIYHGRLDDSWKDENKVTRHELKNAINNHISDIPIATKQIPSMGCSIKWVS